MATVGFDFGTTNSLISVYWGDRMRALLDPADNLPIPSVVSYQGGKTIVGKEAKRNLAGAGLGIHGNTIRSPKTLLGRESVYVDGVERAPVDIVADVVRHVCTLASQEEVGRSLGAIDRAVVTIPVNMDGRRRAALREAFSRAGLRIVQFIHEPLAALYGHLRNQQDPRAWLRQFEGKHLLVFDWGGGTLDLTLCRLSDGMVWQRMNDGTDEVGGDVFDEVIRADVIERVMNLRKLEDGTRISPEGKVRLLERCEQAKIALSSRTTAAIFVPGFFQDIADPDLTFTLSRDLLEEICRKTLDKGLSRIEKVLENAGISRLEIALCLATGGMAHMPAIKQRLHEWFGPQRVDVSDKSSTLISEGAAWAAHDRLGLVLAKDVELLLARNTAFTLVNCGTPMPQQGEVSQHPFHFYCSDPRDGHAKFQFQTPLRPGAGTLPNEPRKTLQVMSVTVDSKAKPLRERLELDVAIDDNLVLTAVGRSINSKGMSKTEIHDLEFGIRVGEETGKPRPDIPVDDKQTTRPRGSLVARSNVASSAEDKYSIPGELLYRYEPEYFDVRRNPPEIQVDERLYYEPCSLCGRASNDPLCRCASVLAEAEKAVAPSSDLR